MKTVLVPAILLMALSGLAQAQPPNRDPDWPCQAVKVPELSIGAFWTGPPVDQFHDTWQNDPQIADLATRISQRRMTVDDAQKAIADFAKSQGDAKTQKLSMLMAGVFDVLDHERTEVLDGLDRFGKRQMELAASIRTEAAQMTGASADPDKQNEIQQHMQWDTRVFEQRRQSIQFACAVPSEIEQRLFALARAIQQAMG
jgi:hypothetical protein